MEATSETQSMTAQSTLVTPSPTLPLVGAALRVEAKGGVARTILEQTFENQHADPLCVTYVLPLPADAAVSGFSFRIGDRRIEGEIDRKATARERFEEAIAQGKTAAILEQERSSLFTQEIGNVPPGAKVVCEIVVDQRLRWLDEGAWEWRFPLAAAPRYLGEPGRVLDADKLALDVARTVAPRASLHMTIVDELSRDRSPESPSHPLQVREENGARRVELGSGNRVELDRDVVVRWPVAQLSPRASIFAEKTSLPDAHALLTLVPPLIEARAEKSKRDLVVLIDTSGSMEGSPLDQARRTAMALVDGLDADDSIELVEFSHRPNRFTPDALAATPENKRRAMDWLGSLRASGGTEMRAGILEALRPLRDDAQRQVVIITDGLIGFEQEIVQTILERLPKGSRVHTVGVGSSVNRSLTMPAARAGRGVEIVLGLGEDPERAVARLRARTEAPLVTDVTVSGDALLEVAPMRVPDLYAGAPTMICARVRAQGGELTIHGKFPHGSFQQRVQVKPIDGGGALCALFGREAVEDAETRLAAGAPRDEIDARVEKLGLDHRIATRLTSWVAIDRTPSVDPRAPTRREVVPQMLPHGMSVEGLGLRPTSMPFGGAALTRQGMIAPMGRAAPVASFAPPPAPSPARPQPRSRGFVTGTKKEESEAAAMEAPPRAAKATARPSEATPTPRPTVRGKIILRKGREVTIEIATKEAIEWEAMAELDVVLDDGHVLRALVDTSRTTTKTRLFFGRRARLVLVLPVDTEAKISRITFDTFDVELG